MLRLKKANCILIAGIIIMLSLPFAAFAQNMSVSLDFICEGKPIEGCEMRLYKVANADGSFTDAFSGYSVSFDKADSDSMANAAKTLANYIDRDSLKPIVSSKTNALGRAEFTIDSKGTYLVIGDKAVVDGVQYTPESLMFNMPATDEKGNEVKSLLLCPKYDKDETEGIAVRKVLKSWINDYESTRPESITVELICDSEVYDTVVLNKDNSWSYEWKNLDPTKTWSLIEKDVPNGYSVNISLEGVTFHVVNSGNIPSSNETTIKGDSSSGNKKEDIPRTGALWWPVPYIACLGLLLIIIGYVKKYKNADAK